MTPKRSVGNSPYMLVYGKEARLPLSVELPALDIVRQLEMFEEQDPMSMRYAELMKLEESRDKAMKALEYHQLQTNFFFDKKVTKNVFKVGDLVLKWDVLKSRPGHHTKFDMWTGPFIIRDCKEHNAYQLATIDREMLPILVNGIHVKPCFQI